MSNFIFIGFLLTSGAFGIYRGLSMVASGTLRSGWATVKGQLIQRAVRQVKPGLSVGSAFAPDVKYHYRVANKDYIGELLYPSRDYSEGPGFAAMQKVVDDLPDEVLVYYNTSRPEEAYLRSFPGAICWLFAAGGLVSLLAGAVQLLLTLRGRGQ